MFLALALTLAWALPSVSAQPAPSIVAIGAVQGVVADSERGTAHQSPRKGQDVTVRGVVTELSLQRASNGALNHGLFLQNTQQDADQDPLTSDGIFVFIGSRSTSIGTYQPRIGDELVLSGRVDEFFNLTELTSPRLTDLVRQGVDLNLEVPAFEAQPPDNLADAQRFWERHESMRAHLPAGSIVTGARDVFGSTQDSEMWVIRPDSSVAQRADAYQRRVFRDPHPLDNHPETGFDDGNGYRILLGNSGLEATSGAGTLLTPSRTFDTVNNELVGSVLYTFGKYRIEVSEQPSIVAGPDPSLLAPPPPIDANQLYSVASFNLENLYDFRDDPNDGCDFAGNAGCPGVQPPFDYVPASDAAYRTRLDGLAQQIVDDLRSPDLLLVQEVEDQDICSLGDADLICGVEDNADGQPDTLEDLALAIQARGGPSYASGLDRDGADDRGIIAGILFRTDRVQLLAAEALDPVLGFEPQVNYRGVPLDYNTQVSNPKALNAQLPADIDRSTGTD
ncbi:MAG TPA: endonuclease, partial [Chloroflexota bacterium]|nr:endonuclease [Chloroflexota bacterium]